MSALSTRDEIHRDMLRSTAAMIQARWPGRYDDLAQRLEDLTLRIAGMVICELPHRSVEEEDECEERRLASEGTDG